MLEIKDIAKKYRDKQALSPLNFTLEKGVYALLGPNGAGKSTLMNIITDNLKPDKGTVFWEGEDTRKLGKGYRQILGYAPQQQGLYEEFTARYFLTYLAALKEVPKQDIPKEVERVAAAVNLQDQLDRRLGGFSGGMKQRALIAQALIGNPKLIVLDEPTAGLDPKERVRIRELCEKLAEDKTLLVATHVVSDIETIAKEVLVLKDGKLLAKSTVAELVATYAPEENLEAVYMRLFGGDL